MYVSSLILYRLMTYTVRYSYLHKVYEGERLIVTANYLHSNEHGLFAI